MVEMTAKVEPLMSLRLRKIAQLSSRYIREYLGSEIGQRDILKDDWYEALKFFYGRSFYQGRRDELSERFYRKALQGLDGCLGKSPEEREISLRKLEREGWLRSGKANDPNPLQGILKKYGVNKNGDRRMVISSLNFISSLPDLNIVNHALAMIKGGEVDQAYEEIDGIYSVGDKVTSFFLRDLVTVFDLEPLIMEERYVYLQPVDIWVQRVGQQIGLIDRTSPPKQMKLAIIDRCLEHRVSPVAFNQGAWYLGAHSLELLLEILGDQSASGGGQTK